MEIFKGVKIDVKCDCKKKHSNLQVYINNSKYFVLCPKNQNEVDVTKDFQNFLRGRRY